MKLVCGSEEKRAHRVELNIFNRYLNLIYKSIQIVRFVGYYRWYRPQNALTFLSKDTCNSHCAYSLLYAAEGRYYWLFERKSWMESIIWLGE